MRRLLRTAERWGLWVEWAPLGDRRGYYEHNARTITLNSAMPEPLLRSTLAHELGHAHYGHVPTGDRRLDGRHETLANRYAADLLITDDAYAAAERLAGPHAGALALELDVAVYVVEAWQDLHHPYARRTG